MGLQCFEIYILWMLYKELSFANDNDSYWLWRLIYLFIINGHIVSVEFGFNSFNATCDFNTKAHLLKAKIFTN